MPFYAAGVDSGNMIPRQKFFRIDVDISNIVLIYMLSLSTLKVGGRLAMPLPDPQSNLEEL